jgi:hypothetical protein
LRTRFSDGDYFRLSDLLQEIHSIKQGDLDLASYFTSLQILWQELDALRPTLTCVCSVQCTCSICTGFKCY